MAPRRRGRPRLNRPSRRPLSCKLAPEHEAALRRLAAENGLSLNALMTVAVGHFLPIADRVLADLRAKYF